MKGLFEMDERQRFAIDYAYDSAMKAMEKSKAMKARLQKSDTSSPVQVTNGLYPVSLR